MPYVDPNTVHNPTTGQIIPASWGDVIRDNQEYQARNKPHCRVYNSADISVANASVVALTFNSERYDIGGCHSTSSNTSALFVPAGEGGKYLIGGCAQFAGNATGGRSLTILLNGVTSIGYQTSTVVGAGDHPMSLVTEYALAAGDFVQLVVIQTSGGALNVEAAGNYSPEFWFRWTAAV